jgi:hypothetical protein
VTDAPVLPLWHAFLLSANSTAVGTLVAEVDVAGPPHVVIEVDRDEAAAGVLKTVHLTPGPGPVTVRVPRGTADNTVLRVQVPGPRWEDPTGEVRVTVRIRQRHLPAMIEAGPPLNTPEPQYHDPWAEALPGGTTGQYVTLSSAAPPSSRGAAHVRSTGSDRRPWITVGAVAALLVAVLGTVAVLRAGGSDTPSGSAPGVRTATATSPESYQQVLSALDVALSQPYRDLSATVGGPTLRSAADKASTATKAEVEKLNKVSPPAAAAGAHRQLVESLGRLQYEVSGIDRDRQEGRACTGPSAIALLSQSTAATGLRTASEALKTADAGRPYSVGAFLPATTTPQNRRLDQGTFVKRSAKGGFGAVRVDNTGTRDSVVTLAGPDGRTTLNAVYVRGGASFTVPALPDATYSVYVATGADWDSGARVFTRDCEFRKAAENLSVAATEAAPKTLVVTVDDKAPGLVPVEQASYPAG